MTSTEIVKRDDNVVAALVEGKELPEARIEDPEVVAQEIAQRILGADDVDAILGMFESTPMQELLGVPLEITGVRFNASTFTEGPPVYAVIDAKRLDDGSGVTATCGGRSIMAALYRMWQLDAFPQRLQVVESKNPTKAGYKPLLLKRATPALAAAAAS